MSLTGFWQNQLKSVMFLEEDKDGTLSGIYRSIVGRDPHPRPLAGRSSEDEKGKQLLGFAVRFHIDNPGGPTNGHFSLCTWSGWERNDKITTHWLLTLSKLDANDEWSSTLIGEDAFKRIVANEATRELVEGEIERLKGFMKKHHEAH